jgi:prophage regulatory protein
MKFIRTEVVVTKTGLSRTSVWRLEREGTFPKRRQLGTRSVGWVESEVEAWMKSREVVDSPENSVCA